MAWRGYLDDMLALLDVKLLTPLLDFNEIFFGGELKHWTPPSKPNFKEKTIIKFSKNINN